MVEIILILLNHKNKSLANIVQLVAAFQVHYSDTWEKSSTNRFIFYGKADYRKRNLQVIPKITEKYQDFSRLGVK